MAKDSVRIFFFFLFLCVCFCGWIFFFFFCFFLFMRLFFDYILCLMVVCCCCWFIFALFYLFRNRIMLFMAKITVQLKMRSTPVSQKFPQRCLWNSSNARLTDDGLLWHFPLKLPLNQLARPTQLISNAILVVNEAKCPGACLLVWVYESFSAH